MVQFCNLYLQTPNPQTPLRSRPRPCVCAFARMCCAAAEVVTKLLRNMEYCSYAATAGKVFEDLDTAERKFNEVSQP